MARNRSKIQRQLDRAAIAELTLKGWSQVQIAQHLEVDQSTVSRDLKAIQTEWKEKALRDFDSDRSAELERLSLLEKEYWSAWERSQQAKETSLSEQLNNAIGNGTEGNAPAPGRLKTATRTEQRTGDPAFLAGVQKCIEQRCKLLGLYAPLPSDGSSKGNGAGLTPDAVAQIRAQILGIPVDELSTSPLPAAMDR